MKITALVIFRAPSDPKSNSLLTLAPPSPFARRIPLHLHPSVSPITPMFEKMLFRDNLRWAEDKSFRDRNYAQGKGVRHGPGGGTLEWAAWVELTDPSERITSSMIPFFGDMMRNLPTLLPREHRPPPG